MSCRCGKWLLSSRLPLYERRVWFNGTFLPFITDSRTHKVGSHHHHRAFPLYKAIMKPKQGVPVFHALSAYAHYTRFPSFTKPADFTMLAPSLWESPLPHSGI